MGLDLLSRAGMIVVGFGEGKAVVLSDNEKRLAAGKALTGAGLREVPLFYLPAPAGLYYIKVRVSLRRCC
jgi:hypothetical protein